MTVAHEASAQLPLVVVSLDLELRWGMHDRLGLDFDGYRENIENVALVVPALLRLFLERGIHATWAYVGALGCADWNEYFRRAPVPPTYRNPSLAVKPEYAELDPTGRLHFAPELLAQVAATAGQELGTHTFSHLFVREPGVTIADLLLDLQAAAALGEEKFGGAPLSLVFPRNQCAYLEALDTAGVRIWRQNQMSWYYNCNEQDSNTLIPRALRLLEDLSPLVRRSYPQVPGMTRASLFVRYSLPPLAWRLHLARIAAELEQLPAGYALHLWWHPHNLGRNLHNSLDRAEQIADLIALHLAKGRLASKNMKELLAP